MINKRIIGIVIFLISMISYFAHPFSINDSYTQLSIFGLIIGFILITGR